MGRAVKNSLQKIIKQVRLEGGFERGGRIRVAECLRQIVPDRDLSPDTSIPLYAVKYDFKFKVDQVYQSNILTVVIKILCK